MKLEPPNDKKNSKSSSFFLILIVLAIIFLVELLLYFICSLNFTLPKIIAIFIQIFLHLLLIRNIVYNILFIGQFWFLSRQQVHLIGEEQASFIFKYLSGLFKSLVYLSEKNIEKNINKISSIKKESIKCINLVNFFINIFTKMKEKFQLSKYQIKLYEQLIELNNLMEKYKIIENLSLIIENNINNSQNIIFPKDYEEYYEKLFEEFFNPLQKTLEIIANYMNLSKPWYSYKKYLTIFFDDTFASLNQFHIEMSLEFKYEERRLHLKDGNIIDYSIIISNDYNNNNNNNIKKNLMIICGPNGSPYQYYCKNIRLDNYLKEGIDVICWNYRGYGYSTGTISINNIKSDIIELYNEIVSWNKYSKIGVHGISIGGIPSCYLANKKKICVLISDRNFGQVDFIIKDYYLGNYLYYLFKCLFIPNTRTIDDFINAKCYKIILNDPFDEIVRDSGSMKNLISEFFVQNYLVRLNKNHNDKINVNLDNSLSVDDIGNNDTNISALDLVLDCKNDVNNFKKCFLDLCDEYKSENLEKKEEQSFLNKINIFNLFSKEDNPLYSRLQGDNNLNSKNIEFIKENLTIFFKNFESGGDTLNHIFKIRDYRRKELFLNNFFNNFLIFGIKYSDEKEKSIHFFSTEERKKIINFEIDCLNFILNSEEINLLSKKQKIINNINLLQKYLTQISQNLNLIIINEKKNNINNKLSLIPNDSFEELNTISTEKLDNEDLDMDKNNSFNNYEKKLIELGRGNLITIKCGHNGQLYYNEVSTLHEHIQRCGITVFSA